MQQLLKITIFFSLFLGIFSCHNSTGTCLQDGFHCVSGEIVNHSKRCDNIEDCIDGTDEFLCNHDSMPFSEKTSSERYAIIQGSCVNCNCAATAYNIPQSSAWWQYAIVAPTDISLMTGTGVGAGRPCNFACVTQITVGFYKKNRICRGWLCCARQRTCVSCSTSGICSSVTVNNRCY
jgi:hypothetical protein